MSMRCEEVVAAMATGGPIRRWRARRHAARCPRCAAARDELRQVAEALAGSTPADRRPAPALGRGRRRARSRRSLRGHGGSGRPWPGRLAAVVLGAIGVWWVLVRWISARSRRSSRTSSRRPSGRRRSGMWRACEPVSLALPRNSTTSAAAPTCSTPGKMSTHSWPGLPPRSGSQRTLRPAMLPSDNCFFLFSENPMRTWLTLMLVLAAGLAPASADEPKSKQDSAPQAPGDYRIFEQDMAGAYFIARPLMEKYDALRKRAASLRAEIDGARIDPARARAEVSALQAELNDLLRTIDHAKLYIPGATVHKRTETTHVPIKPDDLLLVDCENVDVRGWDGPDVQCVLEKTVLDDDSGKVADDFAGIELVARKGSGKEFFGFYLDVRDLPKFKDNEDMQNELRRFVFPEFLGREFPYITVKGLDYQEGNRQINVTVRSERGDGFSASQWRRHATLTLLVPRCQRVGIRGGLGRLKVRDLNAGLSVLGQGNRDYTTVYEVVNLGGSLAADNIPIQRIDGVKGNVSVTATAYAENRGSEHGPDGVTHRAYDPKDSVYRNIEGDLRARFCRANLTIGDVGGRVDVENDFGDTVWQTDRELAQKADHRVVSQSGAVTVRLGPKAPGA